MHVPVTLMVWHYHFGLGSSRFYAQVLYTPDVCLTTTTHYGKRALSSRSIISSTYAFYGFEQALEIGPVLHRKLIRTV
jgi:hypothetical protein